MDHFSEMLSKKHPSILLLEEYVNPSAIIHYMCKTCGYDYYNQPRTIYKNGCPHCNNIPRHLLAQKEYEDILQEKTNGLYSVCGIYKGMNVAILHHCNKHDFDWSIKPSKILGRNQGCRYCAQEKHAKFSESRRNTIEDIKKRIFDMYGMKYELLDTQYKNNHTQMIFKHHLADGTSHTFHTTINALLRGEECGVCNGSNQICVGQNDLNTTHPEIAKMLLNPLDGQKYSYGSGKKVDWVCPNCGKIIRQKK